MKTDRQWLNYGLKNQSLYEATPHIDFVNPILITAHEFTISNTEMYWYDY
jgi:hypothetical protein